MAIIKTDSKYYAEIASAIRKVNDLSTLYTPAQMAAAILALRSFSRLPEGYTELSYIESSGSTPIGEQYVDTGVIPLTNDFTVEMKVQSTGDTSDENWFMTLNHAIPTGAGNYLQFGTWSSKFAAHLSGVLVDGNTAATNDVINVALGVSGATVSLTGDATYSGTNANFQSGIYRNHPITILCGNWRCYESKIYLAGNLVRDYVPCISPHGEVGLYDLVTKAFYGNAGTGLFVAGVAKRKLPEGYTQVEYIQSSGTQYIDTGFKPNSNTRVVCDFQHLESTSGWRNIFGARVNNSNLNSFALWIDTGNKIAVFVSATGLYKTFSSAILPTNRNVVDVNKNVATIGSETVTITSQTFQSDFTLNLFASNTSGVADYFSKTKLYFCRIYDNGKLIRDYVPCINPDGKYGLYDLVNAVFYGNAGTGSFTGS